MKRANLTVPEKLKLQREGYKFFCEHHKTANCAIGENIGIICVHAPNHKTKEGCRYWKPVYIEREDEITRLRAENERLREALVPFAAQLDHPGNTYEHNGVRMALVNQDILDRLCRRARAALEGVTEPPR